MIDGFTAREPGITFAVDNHQCLRLLLSYLADLAAIGMALSAPVSLGDTERLRLLLQAGADPRRYADDAPCLAVYAAVRAGCDRELVRLLLDHGADPDAADPDGRSLYRLATGQGNSELAALLRRYGARDDSTGIDWFLSTCLRADQRRSARQLAADPGLPGHLAEAEPHASCMLLNLVTQGRPADARPRLRRRAGGDDGGDRAACCRAASARHASKRSTPSSSRLPGARLGLDHDAFPISAHARTGSERAGAALECRNRGPGPPAAARRRSPSSTNWAPSLRASSSRT